MSAAVASVEQRRGALDERGSEQVVDAQGPTRSGAGGVGTGTGKEAPDLGVVQDAAVPVVGQSDFVCLLHVGRGAVVGPCRRPPGAPPS